MIRGRMRGGDVMRVRELRLGASARARLWRMLRRRDQMGEESGRRPRIIPGAASRIGARGG